MATGWDRRVHTTFQVYSLLSPILRGNGNIIIYIYIIFRRSPFELPFSSLLPFSSSLSADLFPFFVSSLIEASNFRLRLRLRENSKGIVASKLGNDRGREGREKRKERQGGESSRGGWFEGRRLTVHASPTIWKMDGGYPRHERRQREMARFRGMVGRLFDLEMERGTMPWNDSRR